MTFTVTIIGLLIILVVMAWYRARLYLWSSAGLAWLILYAATSEHILAGLFLVLLWTPVMLANVRSLRRPFTTDRIFPIMKSMIPPMSRTESDAIDAGTVWWDAELFNGRPHWQRLLSYPPPKLSPEEQNFMDGPVNELCAMIDDWDITENRMDLPPEVWQFLKDNGFFGMIIPRRYGGKEFSALAHSTVVSRISTRSISAAVTTMVPNSLGPAELLMQYGTEEQRDYYLPRLARGEEIPCFALTGPEAGSDAAAMPDNGVVCRSEFNGESDVLGIRLNWEKRYITLGPVATLLGLAFKLYDPERLLGDREDLGITLALIPTDTPGVTIGQRHFPLNQAFMNGPNWGKDVFIPMDWIIGGQSRIGQGWRMLMDCLSVGRSISLPALSAGGCKLAAHATGAYARVRKQFKMPIGKFEGVEAALARIGASAYMAEATRTLTTTAVDIGEKPSVTSAIAKYHLTETMRAACNDAMDIQGGSGICMGPRNLFGRIYQAIPISITVEGANILTRSMIIFGQGAIRCHPYVLAEMRAFANPDEEQGKDEFDRAFFAHIGFTISNVIRTFLLGLTRGRIAWRKKERTRPFIQDLTYLSSCLAFSADMAMALIGGALKRREHLSARLGDTLSFLYMASAVLKRFEDQNRQLEDWPLVEWSLRSLTHRTQEALYDFYGNFPIPVAGWVLRRICFPLGRWYHRPDDALSNRTASLLLRPSVCRDRLSSGIFIPGAENEPLNKLDRALSLAIDAEPLEKKMDQAVRNGSITAKDWEGQIEQARKLSLFSNEELNILQDMHDLRIDIIQVDWFNNNDFSTPGDTGGRSNDTAPSPRREHNA